MSTRDIHGPPTIVIVDGDAAVLGAVKFAMEMEGYVVYAFRSGSEALAERNLPPAGCIIADHRLPDMTGLSLLTQLRDRGVTLPAILTAGRPSPNLRQQAESFGAAIVQKPLFGSVLLDAIQRVSALQRMPTVG
jgi:two-component system, LuxR family, response regulator FixJ